VFMSTHHECIDLVSEDEVDLTAISSDNESGSAMNASPAREIADASLSTTAEHTDNTYFNLVTLPITISKHNEFWVVVGGEHSGDIVDSLDEATLRVTATNMAMCGGHHPDGFCMGFETKQLANEWQAKLYRSLLSNGWSFNTSMSAKQISGSCWVRLHTTIPNSPSIAEDPDCSGSQIITQDRLVPYSDSDSSTPSRASAGKPPTVSCDTLNKKMRRRTKPKARLVVKGGQQDISLHMEDPTALTAMHMPTVAAIVTVQNNGKVAAPTNMSYALLPQDGYRQTCEQPDQSAHDDLLPELTDSSASESGTDSDDDTTWLKPKARQLQRSSLTVRDPTEQRNSQPVDTCHAEDDMPPLLHVRGAHNGEPFTAGIDQIDIHSDLLPLVNDTSDDKDDYVGPFTTSATRGVRESPPSNVANTVENI
jgi:hypothetical protein